MNIFSKNMSIPFVSQHFIPLKFLSLAFLFLAVSCTAPYDSRQSVAESSTVDSEETTTVTTEQEEIVLFAGVEDDSTVEAIDEQALTEQILRMLEIRTFYFDFDSAALRDDALDALSVHAEAIKAAIELGENFSIVLEGYTDERGTREYNLALGERRAESVGRYLRVNGVPGNIIDTISYGEERPVALGSDEQAWQKNRRVEIRY